MATGCPSSSARRTAHGRQPQSLHHLAVGPAQVRAQITAGTFCSSRYRMVGSAARIRASSVMAPEALSSGTLKSTRSRTRFPRTSMSLTVLLVHLSSPLVCPAPGEHAGNGAQQDLQVHGQRPVLDVEMSSITISSKGSSLRPITCHRPVNARLHQHALAVPLLVLSTSEGMAGRGPPGSSLRAGRCRTAGSSSRLVRRMKRPTRVRRGSCLQLEGHAS